MYNIAALPAPLSPTTPQASVASMFIADSATIGNLPTQRIGGLVADVEVQNNKQGGGEAILGRIVVPADLQTAESESVYQARLANIRISSYPSLFLAQVIAQGVNAEGEQLIATYESFYASLQTPRQTAQEQKQQKGGSLAEFFVRALKDNTGQSQTAAKTPAVPVANSNGPEDVKNKLVQNTTIAPLSGKPAASGKAAPAPQPARSKALDTYIRGVEAQQTGETSEQEEEITAPTELNA